MKILTLLPLAGVAVATVPSVFTLRGSKPTAFKAPSQDVATDNYIQIRKVPSKSPRAAYARALRNGPINGNEFRTTLAGEEPLDNLEEEEYIGSLSFGSQTFEAIIDTGSSDTWLVQAGFTCVDADDNELSEEDCDFGPAFSGTFAEGQIKNENFNIEYGDGEFLTGVLGYENVTIAGITVPHQEVALVDYAYWVGDNTSSGLVGLAYPYLTSAYSGTNASADNSSNNVEYDPLFTTMYKDGLSSPLFSLGLTRNSSEGYIAFGGLPPVSYEGQFASTPITMANLYQPGENYPQYAFYTITADGYVWSNKSSSGIEISVGSWKNLLSVGSSGSSSYDQFPIIVDSGTTLLYLPSAIAEDVLNSYSTPCTYIEDEGAYFAPCDATPPKFGVTIGGETFYVSPKDMLYTDIVDESTGKCMCGIVDGGTEGGYILGDVFLNNVVAVFDVGASEMRFAAREPY